MLVSATGGVLGGLAAVAALIGLGDAKPDGVGSLELAAIAAGSVVGAQLAARYGRRLSPQALRAVIVAVGIAAIVQLVT